MSVILKGVEKPKYCGECFCCQRIQTEYYAAAFCGATKNEITNFAETRFDCPIEQIKKK